MMNNSLKDLTVIKVNKKYLKIISFYLKTKNYQFKTRNVAGSLKIWFEISNLSSDDAFYLGVNSQVQLQDGEILI